MSYLALYRKFRPTDFSSVKGQDHIVTTLQNQLRTGRAGHAYLFCGTRGTGKTTIAKIMAKAVNCENLQDGNPCGECEMCKRIETQTSMNVVEIDAASNNGVDNIREIVDAVRYSPTEGKYRVYIIDEVHMLSTGAFNALLKTLEEPPGYVIFILATTEPQKLPVTILSRCQRYDFKRISIPDITERLKELTAAEGVEADEKALQYVARMADGAMRDALSLLDQCIAFLYGKRLTYDNVLEVLGTVDIEVFARLMRYVAKGDVASCMQLLEEVVLHGRELSQFVVDFVWYLRNLLLAKTADDPQDVLELSSDQLQLLLHEAEVFEGEAIIRYIRVMSELSNQIRYAAQKRVLIEVALIKLCRPMMESDLTSLTERIALLEEKLEKGAFVSASSGTEEKEELQAEEEEVDTAELPKALTEDLKAIASSWKTIIAKVKQPNKTILISAVPSVGAQDHLQLMFADPLDRKKVAQEASIAEIKQAIAQVTGKAVEIDVVQMDGEQQKKSAKFDITKRIKMDIEYVD